MRRTGFALAFIAGVLAAGLWQNADFRAWAASTFTTNLSLEKPGDGDLGWGPKIRANFDVIDGEFGKTYAGHPDTNVACDYVGQTLYDSTDEILFYCITAGNAATADWNALTPQGGQFTDLFMTGKQISNLADGTDSTDAVNLKQLTENRYGYGATTGSSNSYNLTIGTGFATLTQSGQRFCFRANHANSGPATLNVNAIGAKSITKYGGDPLESGDIDTNEHVCVIFFFTPDRFEIVSQSTIVPLDHLPQAALFQLPRGYIAGLITSQDTDADHDIQIDEGSARDALNNYNLELGSPLTKRIDANWAVGDNQGGFPSTLTLSNATWYFVCVIGADTDADGVIDVVDGGYDTSSACANLLTDAAYDAYRVVGFVLTDGSANIVDYVQIDNYWIWKDPPLDEDNATPGVSAVTVTLTVPPGWKLLVNLNVDYDDNQPIYVSAPDANDEAPSDDAAPLASISNADTEGGGTLWVLTNASGQIRYRVAVDQPVQIATLGWRWSRGVND